MKNAHRKTGLRKGLAFILSVCLFIAPLSTPIEANASTTDQNKAANSLSSAVTYYSSVQNKQLSHWEELLAIYASSKLIGSTIDLSTWDLPVSPSIQTLLPKTYASFIISELIKGYLPTTEVQALIASSNNNKFSTDPIDQAMAMLALEIASEAGISVSGYQPTLAIEHLLSMQKSDGGFQSIWDSRTAVDTTGYVALALAPYANELQYQTSINSLVNFFHKEQLANGGFNYYWSYNGASGSDESANSTALAVWGLAAMKEGTNNSSLSTSISAIMSKSLPALTKFQNSNGSFGFSSTGTGSFDSSTSRQVMIALYDLASDSSIFSDIQKNSLYMRSLDIQIDTTSGAIISTSSITVSSTSSITALHAVNAALSMNDMQPSQVSENLVVSVNGVTAGPDEKWTIYVNGIERNPDFLVTDHDIVNVYFGKLNDRVYSTRFDQTKISTTMDTTVLLTLTGKQLASSGAISVPIPNATIYVNGSSSWNFTNKTDSAGKISLKFLSAGTYTITTQLYQQVTIGGISSMTAITHPVATITVSSGQAYSKTVDMRIEGISQSGIHSTPSSLSRNFVASTDPGKLLTAEDALKQYLNTQSISYLISNGFVNSIAGLANPSNWSSYWHFAVDQEDASVGAGSYVIQGGEEILFYFGGYMTMIPRVNLVEQLDGSIRITVKDSSNNPITEASVLWSGSVLGTTNTNGIFVIPQNLATVGYHNLQLTKHESDGIPLIVPLASDYTVKISEKNTLDESNTTLNLSAKPSTSPQAITISSGAINPTIVVPTNPRIALPEISVANSYNAISLMIPKDTHVSSSGIWDGSIQLPKIESISLTGKTISKAVSVGSTNNSLTFDQPVRLLIPGVAGKTIAYLNANGEVVNISEIITADNASAASISLNAAGKTDGFITVGDDIVVWTKHFTTFLAYTNAGGGAPVSNSITVSVSGYLGQTMLATQSLNFTSGMTALSALINTGLDVIIKSGAGYVESINNLSEFDHGVESGWKYTVNGNYPSVSANNYPLHAGDVVRWVYVTKINEGETMQTLPVVSGSLTTIEAKVDTTGNVNASIKNEELKNAIKDGSNLLISSDIASIKFDQAALSKISGQISGDLTVTVNKADSSKLSEADKLLVGTRPVYEFSVKSGSTTISEFGGKVNVSMGYTLAAGEDPNAILIYYITKDGKLELVKNSRYNETTKRVEFTTDHFSAYAVGYHPVAFQDTKTHWAKDSINFLAARGILKGMTSDTFLPGKTVSRAEFVSILANKAGLDLAKYQSTGQGFADVKASDWFAKAVAWASDQGIVNGSQNQDGSMKFDPNANITRQDMAVILSRYLSKVEKTTLATPNAAVTFADQGKIASYASFAVKNMQQAGIINGKTTTTFAPVDSATRAEAGKMIAEMMKVTF